MAESTDSYPLPTRSTPTLDLSHHLQDIAELRAFLENLGISTANTRVERYAQYLDRCLCVGHELADAESIFKNSVGNPFQSPIDWYLYVLREVHELMWILKGFKIHLPINATEKLQLITAGRDFAALDQDSRSRDIQFELRISSYFCQSGFKVDLSTMTDVIAEDSKFVFYIECKRVGSKTKLKARLSEARQQLSTRMPKKKLTKHCFGFIAIDVTKVAFSHNGLTIGVSNEHSRDVIQSELKKIVSEFSNVLSFGSPRKLLGYWLQIHIPSLIMNPPTPLTRFSSFHVYRPLLGRKDTKALALFQCKFLSVSKSDERSLPERILTPRKEIVFPKGSIIRLDKDRIIGFLENRPKSEDALAEVIGSITMNEKEHSFTLFDVSFLPEQFVASWKREISEDQGKGSAEMLAVLYMNRFPYMEPDEGNESAS